MPIQLQIPAPCHEKWVDMNPVRHDCRHCAACDRQIVDFSHKTDAEILQFLQKNDGKLCGRFSTGQLNRPLLAYRAPKRSGLTAMAASFAAVMAAQHPTITAPVASGSMEQTSATSQPVMGKPVLHDQLPADTIRTVSGKILDETGQPVIGALIYFANTEFKTVTDTEGHFTLKIPVDSLENNPLEIHVNAFAFDNKTVPLSSRILVEDLALLPQQTTLTEGITHTMGVLVYMPDDIDLMPRPSVKSRIRHFVRKVFR